MAATEFVTVAPRDPALVQAEREREDSQPIAVPEARNWFGDAAPEARSAWKKGEAKIGMK